MKISISILILTMSFVFNYQNDPTIFFTSERIKKDLKNCNFCWDTTKYTLRQIVDHFPTGALDKTLFNSDQYFLLHIRIPDSFSGCTFEDSPLLLYKKKDNKYTFIKILNSGYNFVSIQNSKNYFFSETKCSKENFERSFSQKVFLFTDENLNTILDLEGFDNSLYYQNIYIKGYGHDQGFEGYEIYDRELKEFKSAIGDTISNYFSVKNFNTAQGKVTSLQVEHTIKILKGINSDQETILTENHNKLENIQIK